MAPRVNEETLNAVCPYFTMFPLSFPQSILEEYGHHGEWVVDPFCGRGTTNYSARLCQLNTVGVDSNPVAIAISEGKLVSSTPQEIVTTAKQILEEVRVPSVVPDGEFWDWAYHPNVLNQICRIKESLLADCGSSARRALRAIMLGALHGHVLKTTASYFSNQCQRTYSPKPAYAVRFWQKRKMKPPDVNVLAIIEKRAERFYSCLPHHVNNVFILGDSRNSTIFDFDSRIEADWIITSPPYYGMKSYLPDQWLRLWFVGGEPKVDYDKSTQLKQTGIETFVSELQQVWKNMRKLAKPTARLIIRFGGLPSVKSEPLTLLKKSLESTGWEIDKVNSAGFSTNGHRQAYQQAKKQNPPVEEFDLWAIAQH